MTCILFNYFNEKTDLNHGHDGLIQIDTYFRGADNRRDDTLEMIFTPPSEHDDSSSSDSDVPLSTFIRKGKTKKGQ